MNEWRNKRKEKHLLKDNAYHNYNKHITIWWFILCRADDDINDVAAMGGVNLAEESQRILGSTEFVGTQIRSCKDEVFLHMTPLQQRIKQIGNFISLFTTLNEYGIMVVLTICYFSI